MRISPRHSIVARLHASLHVQIRDGAKITADESDGMEFVGGSFSWTGESLAYWRTGRLFEVAGLAQVPATILLSPPDPGGNLILRSYANQSA